MTKSADIRALADQGLSVADIARKLGIRYQHAYNVLSNSGSLPPGRGERTAVVAPARRSKVEAKPSLSVDELTGGGFGLAGRWILTSAGEIALDRPVAKTIGVYAFAIDDFVMYVGVATMGIAKRLYFYTKPGVSQITNQRVNLLVKTELMSRRFVDIYTATPDDFAWNGLPVHGSAGLELGLIRKYALPWNMRSSG